MPDTREPFVANNTFFAKTSGVNIFHCGDQFSAFFKGKVEPAGPRRILERLVITSPRLDVEPLRLMGGVERAEVLLSEIWDLLLLQPNGEDGELWLNEIENGFYAKDIHGVLRSVRVAHCTVMGGRPLGWVLHAGPLRTGGLRRGVFPFFYPKTTR